MRAGRDRRTSRRFANGGASRVGERLERARTSLEAEDGSAAARAVAREVGKCEAEATALARRLAHEAIEATEAFETRGGETARRGEDDGDGTATEGWNTGEVVHGVRERERILGVRGGDVDV